MLGEKDSYNVKRQYKEMFSYFTHWSIYKQASLSVNKVHLYECARACVCVCVCVLWIWKKDSFANKNPLMLTKFPRTQWNIQFSSVAQSCLTLCDPMDCSTPGFPVLHQLLELAQTHVHRVGDAIQPSHPLSSLSPPAFNLSQPQGLFLWVSSLHQVAKVLELQLQHQSLQWIFSTDFL